MAAPVYKTVRKFLHKDDGILYTTQGVVIPIAGTLPGAHSASHENGGADEVSVTGLSGLLADDQHVLDTEVEAVITAEIVNGQSIDNAIDALITTHTAVGDAHHAESHTITSHSDIVDATGANIEELTGGGDTILHDHDGISENTGARHTQGTDTTLGTMTADIDMDGSYQVVGLQAPGAAGEALRQTVNITEADLEQLTDGSDTTLHDHDGISENTGARHTQGTDTTLGTMTADIDMDGSYQIVGLQAPSAAGEALRQTVNITEADLETLTDASNADALHTHLGTSILEVQVFG